MSPVRQSSSRTTVLALGGALLGTVLVVALVVFVVGRAGESGVVEVKLGTETFPAGDAEALAAQVAAGGPILFSDVASGQRDIFLQHTSDDPTQGWTAFDARRPDQARDCFLRWDAARNAFTDPCGGPDVDAQGTGLVHYPTSVDGDRRVVVDLNADRRRAATTTSTARPLEIPDEAPSSLVITGSAPPR